MAYLFSVGVVFEGVEIDTIPIIWFFCNLHISLSYWTENGNISITELYSIATPTQTMHTTSSLMYLNSELITL